LITAIFYFPPPRVNSTGLSKRDVLSRIDWVGGVLSIAGTILFVAGLVWGGYQVFDFFKAETISLNLITNDNPVLLV